MVDRKRNSSVISDNEENGRVDKKTKIKDEIEGDEVERDVKNEEANGADTDDKEEVRKDNEEENAENGGGEGDDDDDDDDEAEEEKKRTTTFNFDGVTYSFKERPSVLEEKEGKIEFRVVNNDNTKESLMVLTGLKNIFQKQLPKMPREYISRLVYDRSKN